MTKAAFFGSSTVLGIGSSNPDRRFTSVAARALGWEEINLGAQDSSVTGRDDEGNVIDDSSAIARLPDVLDAQPDLVVILFGACDYRRSRPLGSLDRFRQGTFHSDYDTMLRGLLHAVTPEKIVVSTEYFRGYAESENASGVTLNGYNEAIRKLAAKFDIRLLDAYSDSGITADNWPTHTEDEINLDDSGHECLAAFFIQALHG